MGNGEKIFKRYADLVFIGDVRDRERLYRAFAGIDLLAHAAATKIVPTAERDPFECVKTNVIGAMNVIDAAIDKKVEKVVALSTDKASNPINLYGATKLASDKLFVAANGYGVDDTRFSVVRYGNVMGSRGSVIPFFIQEKEKGELPITDLRMTRFMISLQQGVELVDLAFKDMVGGEIYVKKIPSMKVTDIAKAVDPNCKLVETGIRPGEKLHEQMIGPEDASFTYEYPSYYKIIPSTLTEEEKRLMSENGMIVPENFSYTSQHNKEWMTLSELTKFLNENAAKFLKI